MRSLRLSLVVYFLALLALALGAVSLVAYQTANGTLLDKKKTTAALIETQYQENCRKERARLDDALSTQARTLARLVQFQTPWSRLHMPERTPVLGLFNVAGLVGAPTAPGGGLTIPLWTAASVWMGPRPLSLELYRPLFITEIRFDEDMALKEGDGLAAADYFQIDSLWGSSYRSPGLRQAGVSFPIDRSVFAAEHVLELEYDDLTLRPNLLVRRVTLKAPAVRPFWFPSGRGRPRPAGDPGAAADRQPVRPALFIQCAGDLQRLEAKLATFRDRRDEELARLDVSTSASLANLRNSLLLINLITFGATMLGSCWLVWRGLSPLRRLSDAVSRVSEKDFRLPFHEPRLPGELRPIVERLAQTLEMLKRAFGREKQAAADISHELRTPLAALLTTTEVALRKPRSPQEYREVLEDCRASGQQMSRLVERLLTLARLDAGVDTMRPQPVDVAGLAEQCVALVRPLAEARGLSVRYQGAGPVQLTADPDKLREVLTNLLHNAIQYNRPDGRVEVLVGRHNGTLDLEVRDTGVGIAPEARKHIFERFYRADSSRTGDGMNAGLGLAIVKGYVDLMGGKITVESTEGEGSSFRVQLPVTS
jgi:heavy metal sensor kinase